MLKPSPSGTQRASSLVPCISETRSPPGTLTEKTTRTVWTFRPLRRRRTSEATPSSTGLLPLSPVSSTSRGAPRRQVPHRTRARRQGGTTTRRSPSARRLAPAAACRRAGRAHRRRRGLPSRHTRRGNLCWHCPRRGPSGSFRSAATARSEQTYPGTSARTGNVAGRMTRDEAAAMREGAREDPFLAATEVLRIGASSFSAELDAGYSIMGKPNGGYILSVLARAATMQFVSPGIDPHCLAASGSYIRSPDCGPAQVEVTVRRNGTNQPGRRASFRTARSQPRRCSRAGGSPRGCRRVPFGLDAGVAPGPRRL